MLIERVLDALDVPDPEDRVGNPLRGSRLGRCVRQSGYMLYPDLFPPTPLQARAKLIFRFGDMIHDLVREQFRRVLPGEWGMEEERFHFVVPLSVYLAGRALENPALRLSSRGLILDQATPALLVPLHVDGIADLPKYGLASVEIKSMSTYGFRRALAGDIDYPYRVQMATALDATGLYTQVFVSVRKDTCHMLEIVYSKRVSSVEIRVTKSSRMVEVMRVATGIEGDWESVEITHPFEPILLSEARERVRMLLASDRFTLPPREHGPDFICPSCVQGQASCRSCKGAGLRLSKLGKPSVCKRCNGVGQAPCEECVSGLLAEQPLPWQCSYCPYTLTCYPGARLELTDRPRYVLPRPEEPLVRWMTTQVSAARPMKNSKPKRKISSVLPVTGPESVPSSG